MNQNQKTMYEAQAGQPEDRPLDYRQTALLKMILRHCKSERENTFNIAELSVGNGALSLGMLQASQKFHLTCVDISSILLVHLEKLLEARVADWRERARLLEGNLDSDFCLLPDTSFDAVVAIDVLEHVFDVFAFVGHCRRILRPGAVLLLRVPNIAYIKHRFGLLLGHLPITSSWYGPRYSIEGWRRRYGWDGGHLHYFNRWSLEKLLNEAGFEVREVSDPGASQAAMRALWPGMLCGNLAVAAIRVR